MKPNKVALFAISAAVTVSLLQANQVSEAFPPPTAHRVDKAHKHTAPSRSRGLTSIKQLPKVWQRLAYCESRYQQHATSPSGLHHGYFQIHKGFFAELGINWKTATLQQQWEVAQYVYKRQGARAWSCAKKAGLK